LGHIVSSKGVETDPDKVSALRTWPRPQTLSELKSFLGFAGYYRRFVRDYSKIVKPLNDLTGGYPPYRKGQKTSGTGGNFNPKEPFAERWTPACQKAFEVIIGKLTSSPVLGFADPKLPYELPMRQQPSTTPAVKSNCLPTMITNFLDLPVSG